MDTYVDESGASSLVQLSDELAEAVERAGAGTVTVEARRRMPASGIVWDAGGIIVTANHVVERDQEINIHLADGRKVEATLVGRDPGSDLAVLQVATTDLAPLARREEPVRVGHLVLAVARPGPSGPMASFGAVSLVGGPWRTHHGGMIEGFIRADVAMLPGFSGGPLVDPSGALIGLNSSTLGQGGGLTVPVAAIESVTNALRMHGRVRRGYLGIGAQTVQMPAAVRAELGLEGERGLLVVSVEPESPAEKGGLILGDVILTISGVEVTTVEELQDHLSGERVGRDLAIVLLRGGTRDEAIVTVGERGL
ncbi:MAG: S1C family serine protease [Chloroflexota bacterium]|nr:S1C family serine protease [Chloroflexota bacterium]